MGLTLVVLARENFNIFERLSNTSVRHLIALKVCWWQWVLGAGSTSHKMIFSIFDRSLDGAHIFTAKRSLVSEDYSKNGRGPVSWIFFLNFDLPNRFPNLGQSDGICNCILAVFSRLYIGIFSLKRVSRWNNSVSKMAQRMAWMISNLPQWRRIFDYTMAIRTYI